MRNNATIKNTQNDRPEMDRATQFLQELTSLSVKHGIGITGQPILFVMENEDYNLAYEIDDDSNLSMS